MMYSADTKYRVLLCGKSKAIVNDFFSHLQESIEAQTTSLLYNDMISHIKYFSPDALVYCMHKDAAEAISVMTRFQSKLEQFHIPLVIIGNEEECEEFQKCTYKMANLALTKPILIRIIGDEIIKLIEEWKAKEPEEDLRLLIKKEADADSDMFGMEKKEAISTKKHVLVVDDDPMMLKLIKEQLKDSYTVATAISGNIALKFLENKRTDMIILDYEMPGENGADVLKKIRDNEATSNLPVIFLTGITDREKIHKVLSYKPQGYLLKPIEREKLLQIIANTIG